MQPICEVTITAPDAAWLAEFTRKLVEERLAACGHNLVEIRSIYRWDGQVHDEPEARVMLHTRRSLVSEIIKIVNQEHPYEVPCVLATAIDQASPDYHAWVLTETKDSSSTGPR
ncbi:divalent-cation tolerance protein CutA [Glycomyces algeriensis]|uniref:Dihydroorotate dehydrogenase n=1 Tax=Glycomyces algeriensis TaxID=256037 RepID=A0A9W6LHC8_9ACTN|nr:divalent-cation tolerance protein CutA [Glycomyces algeriensis]MDA1364990.1 divalent-cation tolerance protein CutA [Glycomyces algeriensis]MDR7349949.1 periplasmic divalent cation tolerance protein [Glycomyces algeriensis]GLI42659.1 dihydroorotate dehydrogenase [Glycomyces algeriensis]